MRKKFLKLFTLLLLVVAGVVGQSEARPSSNDLTLADLESFTNTEANTEQGNNGDRPPEWWEYVRDRYITTTPKTYEIVSESDFVLKVEGKEYKGDVIRKKHKYQIVAAVYNCDGKQDGSWCDQRRVRVEVSSITNVETGEQVPIN